MTDNKDKVRGLFLAALMVLSVFAGTVALTGTVAAEQPSDADANVTSLGTYWQGQTLFLAGNAGTGTTWQIRNTDGNTVGTLVTEFTLNSTDNNATISTSGLDGEYVIVDGDKDVMKFTSGGVASKDAGDVSNNTIEVAVQSFSTSWADSEVTDESSTTLDVSSNRGSFDVVISADGISESELGPLLAGSSDNGDGTVTVSTSASGSITADFSSTDIAPGTYDFDVEVADTDASASASIDVVSAGDTEWNFDSSIVDQNEGDVAQVTVNVANTKDGHFYLGDDASGYTLALNLTDGDGDGTVTFDLNTYKLGTYTFEEPFTTADNDDTVEVWSETSLSGSGDLDRGDYPMNVTLSDGTETDVGTFVITSRSTDSMNVWTAPGGTQLSSVLDAASEDDELAQGDWLVVQVSGTGFFGYLESTDNLTNASGLGLDTTLVQSNPGPNQDAKTFNVSNGSLVTDAENDTFYFLTKLDSDALTDAANDTLANGDAYTATFTVNDSNPYVASGTTEEVSADFSIAASEYAIDEPVVVGAEAAQTISGTSTAAAGSAVNVRVRATGDTPFLKTNSTTVNADGTWSTEFDFSGVPVGVEFTVTVTNPSPDVTADGTVAGDPAVTFDNQDSQGTQVTVASANLPAGGYVAIHDASGDIIGSSSFLSAGTHEDVAVTLNTPYESSGDVSLTAMAHRDDGDKSFAAADDAAYMLDGAPVTDDATVSVQVPTETVQETVTVVKTVVNTVVETKEVEVEVTKEVEVEVTRTVVKTVEKQGTPGFGIAVALIALIAAALLAVRRKD